jgi:hypothetical protein
MLCQAVSEAANAAVSAVAELAPAGAPRVCGLGIELILILPL